MIHSKIRFFLLLFILYAIVVAYSDSKIVKRTTRILAFRKGSTFFVSIFEDLLLFLYFFSFMMSYVCSVSRSEKNRSKKRKKK